MARAFVLNQRFRGTSGRWAVEDIGSSIRIARLRDLARWMQIPVVASVTLDISNICKGLPVAVPMLGETLKYSSADFLATLTKIRSTPGDGTHEFEILQNPFGPTATIQLVYHKTLQHFYEFSEQTGQ